MKIISDRERGDYRKDPPIGGQVLKHLGMWEVNPPEVWRVKVRPPPKTTGPPKPQEHHINYSMSQIFVSDNLSRASRSNEWLYVDPEYPETFAS
jgi:hypothetical protein